MASIVKANASLTAGGLAVIKRNYSLSDEGALIYEAEYACLSQFANNHAGKFKTGAEAPTALPSSISLIRLDGAPKLYEVATYTQNGLTYFSAKYSAGSQEVGQYTLTTSTEVRNFSGTFDAEVATKDANQVTQIVRGSINISFDYQSITVTIESKSSLNIPEIKGTVGQIFNFAVTKLSGVEPSLIGKSYYKATTLESTSVTQNSRGLYTYVKTSSGIYQNDTSGLSISLTTSSSSQRKPWWGI
jgi:hypothetical protein